MQTEPMSTPIGNLIERRFGHLRFPQLFLITAAVFVLDLFIPDLIPFVDEILLGLATLLLGTLRRRTGVMRR